MVQFASYFSSYKWPCFLLEEQHENFVAAVTNSSGHQMQGENERQRKKNEPEDLRHFLQKTCN